MVLRQFVNLFVAVLFLKENGQLLKMYALPSGVKSIMKDGSHLYVGCNNGGVYGNYIHVNYVIQFYFYKIPVMPGSVEHNIQWY